MPDLSADPSRDDDLLRAQQLLHAIDIGYLERLVEGDTDVIEYTPPAGDGFRLRYRFDDTVMRSQALSFELMMAEGGLTRIPLSQLPDDLMTEVEDRLFRAERFLRERIEEAIEPLGRGESLAEGILLTFLKGESDGPSLTTLEFKVELPHPLRDGEVLESPFFVFVRDYLEEDGFISSSYRIPDQVLGKESDGYTAGGELWAAVSRLGLLYRHVRTPEEFAAVDSSKFDYSRVDSIERLSNELVHDFLAVMNGSSVSIDEVQTTDLVLVASATPLPKVSFEVFYPSEFHKVDKSDQRAIATSPISAFGPDGKVEPSLPELGSRWIISGAQPIGQPGLLSISTAPDLSFPVVSISKSEGEAARATVSLDGLADLNVQYENGRLRYILEGYNPPNYLLQPGTQADSGKTGPVAYMNDPEQGRFEVAYDTNGPDGQFLLGGLWKVPPELIGKIQDLNRLMDDLFPIEEAEYIRRQATREHSLSTSEDRGPAWPEPE